MSVKNVFIQVASFHGIAEAEKDTRKGKRYDLEKLEFFNNYEENVHEIVDRLLRHDPPPDSYHYFYLYEPKLRKVVYADYWTKIIQRACYNALNPILRKGYIFDSHSCVPDHGQLSAMQRVAEWVNYADKGYSKCYYLKMDAEKFFYRIDHEILMKILRKKISDLDMLWLLEHYICHASKAFGLPFGIKSPMDIPDSEMLWDVGVPIGGGLSHTYGNLYVDPFDQIIKREWRLPYYARYMDDMIIIHPDKDVLHKVRKFAEEFFRDELRLRLNEKTAIRPLNQGIEFVGYRIFPGHVSIRKSTSLRMKRHLRQVMDDYRDGELSFEKARETVMSYKAMMKHVNCDALEKHIFENFVLTHNKED